MRRIIENLSGSLGHWLSDWLTALLLVILYTAISIGMISFAGAQALPQTASVSQGSFVIGEVKYAGHILRTGTYLEQGHLKGCVLYLEGLGDSILNHEPLFRSLAQAGYRTVAFDYFGQGGSSGEMSATRLTSNVKSSEIRTQAKAMWKHFSTEPDPVRGLTCAGSRKLVIGWSTGGLAAYQLAHERWAQGVVLLAPGIHPNKFVGTAGQNWFKLLSPFRVDLYGPGLPRFALKTIITEKTLTRARYAPGLNPHVDRVKPDSPLRVPLFAINLMRTSQMAQGWKIDPSVKGLVLLSGYEDTYVNSAATRRTLRAQAPHFDVRSYPGALHELDNELEDVRTDLVRRTISFLNSVR